MRLRLFERVRRLAHPRAGRFRPRRDRAGETARHDRPWEVRPPGRLGETRGQVMTTGPETAGRHRRGGADVHPSRGFPPDPRQAGPRQADPRQAGPPWADHTGPQAPYANPQAPYAGGPRTARPGPPAGYPGPPAAYPGPAARGGSPVPASRPPVPPPASRPPARPPAATGQAGRAGRADQASQTGAVPVGGARARVRPKPSRSYGTAPVAPPDTAVVGKPVPRVRPRPAPDQQSLEAGYLPGQRPGAARSRLPFAHAHRPAAASQPDLRDGRRNCGTLEAVLWRQWDTATYVPDQAVLAVDRLAELPQLIKDKLAAGLDGIFVGPGGVPQLDDMTALAGVPLPSGRATWDACAGAYGERKIVVGTRPSPTPDVMCHEVGHALDDIDAPPGQWQSDSAEFRMLYDQCQPHLASDFHKQRGGLGRKEFFADAFAAIASRQRPALVDMLGGDTRTALNVMLYFNRRYGM
jgi:hypothetical protein